MEPARPGLGAALLGFFGTPRFSSALTLTIVGSQLGALFFQQLIGWPGLLGIMGLQVLLASLSLAGQRHEIEWNGLLPISLIVFVGWACISVFWSQYQWATLGSVVYFLVVTTLGIYVGLVRDTLQIARAFGDVLRAGLGLSLALEIFSGVLIDSPIPFLDIGGHLAELGPIQGIFGVRNQLGIVSLVALITFGTEFRTRTASRGVAIGSIVLATGMLLLARSPIALGGLAVVALAALALYGLRRLPVERKRVAQFVLLALAVVLAIVAWSVRQPLIALFSASGEVSTRLRLWQQMRSLITLHNLEGWGWVGHWRHDVDPFRAFLNFDSATPTSGLNAYLDVWFQLGLIGLLAFLVVLGLALVRSWLLASKRRSFVFAWPALVLVALLTTALGESSILVEFGWLTFVVCCVKASRELSWRRAFVEAAPPSPLPTAPDQAG